MDNEPDRFIDGIYNYCDRWCERCRFTDRCRVYEREQKQLERHLLRGEDPDDPEVFVRDVTESFDEALGMLQEMADEMGLEVADEPDPAPLREPEAGPLETQTLRWSQRVHALLARIREDMPGIGHDLASDAGVLSEREQDEAIQAVEGVRDAYEVLAFYQTLIPVKMVRAERGVSEVEDDDPEGEPYRRNDALGTAKLVHECLGKAAAALWSAAEFHREWQEEALPLAAEAESLRTQIDRAFPGHREFCRPGFDEPLA
jgi:hypothetical protein